MDIVLRAAIAYVFLIFMLRIVGRRELSTLAPTDVVLLVVIGDLIQNGVTQNDYSVTGIILAVATIGGLTVGSSLLAYKSPVAHRVIEGEPLILVENGRPVPSNLRAERINVHEIEEEMRGQGIESLDQVKWCVLESSGSMSFIKSSG